MAGIKLNTAVKAVPMIYAYTTPEIRRHDGWTKIGYTEQDVATRINQQTHTADVEWHEEWRGKAEFDDGSGDIFTDKAFHAYLQKNNVERDQGKDNEWFKINGIDSKRMFYDFRENRGNIASTESTVIAYNLRDEQEEAVSKALDYFKLHENGAFLWNAKPRFGKTLAAYDLCKRLNAKKVLIVTNRPAIANSWYSDYATFLGTESGYTFVSNVDGIKDRPLVKSREKYVADNRLKDDWAWDKCIEFVSLQDLKGSRYFGGNFDKLLEVKDLTWDILIIDEAHEGASTYKADVAFDHIKRNATLHLSGTPFKMLANDEFAEDAIYNWTYADEQKKKREFVPEPGTDNPYAKLPQLNMFTYQMSEIIKDELEQGKEIDGETVEYAFDLNEFFMCNEKGRFIHNEAVNQFLDAMTTQEKYEEKHQTLIDNFKKNLTETVEKHIKEAEQEVVKTVETDKREAKKRTIEDDIKDHLRGFSRTIPSFLMAYGNDGNIITLATFDRIVPNEVFEEVTSITLTNFRFLRDGGDYTDPDTKEQKHFEGHLFDPIVFDDSVKEFLNKKKQLADYFDENSTGDIFDFIPPQKTNQIFTPKKVVQDMVDRLVTENPGCFDDPNKTFADLYMKSGMYITEIVKRLYQSPRMKALYPDDKERLNHIFKEQVYGCAPTEIIYRICLAYILGFSDKIKIEKHNIRLLDTLKYAKDGTLYEKLAELFPELVSKNED